MTCSQLWKRIVILSAGLWLLAACTHRVEVAAREPITINMNVKIEHEVRLKVEKDLDNLFEDESKGLF